MNTSRLQHCRREGASCGSSQPFVDVSGGGQGPVRSLARRSCSAQARYSSASRCSPSAKHPQRQDIRKPVSDLAEIETRNPNRRVSDALDAGMNLSTAQAVVHLRPIFSRRFGTSTASSTMRSCSKAFESSMARTGRVGSSFTLSPELRSSSSSTCYTANATLSTLRSRDPKT